MLDPGLGRLYLQPLLDVFSRDIHFKKKRKHTIRHLSFKQNSLIYLYFFILNTFTCNSIFWRNTIGIKSTKLLQENLYLLIIDCSMKYLNVQIRKFSSQFKEVLQSSQETFTCTCTSICNLIYKEISHPLTSFFLWQYMFITEIWMHCEIIHTTIFYFICQT